MRQWKINVVDRGIVVLSVILISLRVIAASEGRPNFLIILTDDQDVVLNGMVKIHNHNAQSRRFIVFRMILFVDAYGKDSTVVG